jgi:hypothetical protein
VRRTWFVRPRLGVRLRPRRRGAAFLEGWWARNGATALSFAASGSVGSSLRTLTMETLPTCRAALDEQAVATQGVACIVKCDPEQRGLLALFPLPVTASESGRDWSGGVARADSIIVRSLVGSMYLLARSATACEHHITSGNPEICCDFPVRFSGRPERQQAALERG